MAYPVCVNPQATMRSYQSIEDESRRRNLRFLMGLRTAAFCAQLLAIFGCYYGLSIVLPVAAMVVIAALPIAFNLYSFVRLRSLRPIGEGDLMLGLVIDVIVLALQLNFSGGTSNPFVSFFMLPVILGAVTLSARLAWAIYGLTLLGYALLAIADLYRPMPPRMAGMTDMATPGLIDLGALHMHGMMLGYGVSAAALVYMISRVRANLRARDEEVVALRTQALEQEHLLRLGLLTAGAAHELGTPLTTMAVIIKDWQDLGIPKARDERDAELGTLRNQVLRCKAVISDILDASGQTRGEGAATQALRPFLTGLCDDWRARHPSAVLDAKLAVDDRPIAADRVFAQSLINLLDNALEASQAAGHEAVALDARLVHEQLAIAVTDRGTGFAPDILAALGTPFATTKAQGSDRPRGLGLFLVRNTAKALGGELIIESDAGGGARVRLDIPMAAIGVDDVH